MASEGKLEQLIRQKRAFLRDALKDYSEGGNDMLDDVEAALEEAKAELAHRLDVVSCLQEDEGEEAWRKECLALFNEWFEKWFSDHQISPSAKTMPLLFKYTGDKDNVS